MKLYKKIILATLLLVASAGFVVTNTASAQVSGQTLWKLVSGSIQPMVSSWKLGSSSSRISEGWFTTLNATNLTVGGASAGNLDMGGYNISDIGTATGAIFIATSTTATSTFAGGVSVGSRGYGFADGTYQTTAASALSIPVSIANGGTNNTTFLAPVGGISPIIFFDGTKLTTNTDVEDIGYEASSHTVHTNKLHIHANDTTVATFTNTTQSQSTLGGAGMIGYANPGTAMLSGNRLGFYLFGGATDTSSTTINASGIAGYATENWSGTNQGASVEVYTTPNGATTNSRRTIATFDQNGYVGIATTTPQVALSVATSSIAVAEYRYGDAGKIATSTTATISPNVSNIQHWPIGDAATTLTLGSFVPGQSMKFIVENPNATAGAITWATTAGNQLYWAGGTAPTQTTTAYKQDVWVFTATKASSTIAILGALSPNY